MDAHAKRQRIIKIISQHGHRMTGTQWDKALAAFDGLVKKSISGNAIDRPLPQHPDRKKGKWEAKTDAENDRRSTSSTDKPVDKPKQRRLWLRPKKNNGKPYAPGSWKIKHRDGSATLHQTSSDGKLTVKEIGKFQIKTFLDYPPTAEQLKKWQQEGDQKEAKEMDKESIKKSLAELDRIEKNINLGSPGHQKAARATGLDLHNLPAGTDLAKMSIQDMKALAFEQTREAIAHISEQHIKCYRR